MGLNVAKGAYQHVSRVGADERRQLTPIQNGDNRGKPPLVVSESGLYKLIMRSDKAEAREFQDWITKDVIPAIRKTGGYLLNEQARAGARDDRLVRWWEVAVVALTAAAGTVMMLVGRVR